MREKNRNQRRCLNNREGILDVGKTRGGTNLVGEIKSFVLDMLCQAYIGHPVENTK